MASWIEQKNDMTERAGHLLRALFQVCVWWGYGYYSQLLRLIQALCETSSCCFILLCCLCKTV